MRVCRANSSNVGVPVMLAEILRRDGKLCGIEGCEIWSAYLRLLRVTEKQYKTFNNPKEMVVALDPKQVLGIVEIVLAVKPEVFEKEGHDLIQEAKWIELKAGSAFNDLGSDETLSTFAWSMTHAAMLVVDKSQVEKEERWRISDGLQQKIAGQFFYRTCQFGYGKPDDGVDYLLTQLLRRSLRKHETNAKDFCGEPPVSGADVLTAVDNEGEIPQQRVQADVPEALSDSAEDHNTPTFSFSTRF